MHINLKLSSVLAIGAIIGAVLARQVPEKQPIIDAKLVNIVVTTPNLREEVDFYQNTFGLKSSFRNKTSCFLRAGSVNLVFVASTEKAKKTKNLCLDFAVKDLGVSLAHLTASGLKVDNSDPAILTFADPDGNLVEIVHG